jgi:hypothetical protein
MAEITQIASRFLTCACNGACAGLAHPSDGKSLRGVGGNSGAGAPVGCLTYTAECRKKASIHARPRLPLPSVCPQGGLALKRVGARSVASAPSDFACALAAWLCIWLSQPDEARCLQLDSFLHTDWRVRCDSYTGILHDLTIPPIHLVYLGCTTHCTSTHDQERQRKHAATLSQCAAALPGRAPHAPGSQVCH